MGGSPDVEEVDEPADDLQNRDLTISDAFEIGIHINYLRFSGELNLQVGTLEEGGILNSLEILQNRLVATNTGNTVASQIEDIKRAIFEKHDQSTEKIDDDIGNELSNWADTWEHLLSEELVNERRIKIPNTGILDFEQLMGSPNHLFEDVVWNAMDEVAKRDITEACHSLPLGCSTASLMVSLRAVEYYLRQWYQNETGEELDRGTWGSVLDDLIEIYIAEEDTGAPVMQQLSSVPSVLSNLYYLKEKRDKVSHPDESPSNYEAVITLFMVSGTISEVIREIEDIDASIDPSIK